MKSPEQWATELLPGRSAAYRSVFIKAFRDIQEDARKPLIAALDEAKRVIVEHHSSNVMAESHIFCPYCASENGRNALEIIYNAELK